jgi:ribosomal protein RSM22 (predicted rRNA methylase)
LLSALKERLAEGGRVVILEPALRATARRLMALREELRGSPFAIQAPCPCLGPCPMLPLDKQWCVAEVPWDPPAWFRDLDGAAGLDRRMLSFAYLLAQKGGGARAPVARVVGVPKPQKGKVERWMCTPEGGERWEALSRHGDPEWAADRGAEVALRQEGALKPHAEGWPVRRFRS